MSEVERLMQRLPPGVDARKGDCWQLCIRVRSEVDNFEPNADVFRDYYERHHVYHVLDPASRDVLGLAIVEATGHVDLLVVDPEHWREGVGSGIVEEAVDEFHYVTLLVREDNHRARRFYESQGFEKVGHVDDYYHDDVDGIRMGVAKEGSLAAPVLRAIQGDADIL